MNVKFQFDKKYSINVGKHEFHTSKFLKYDFFFLNNRLFSQQERDILKLNIFYKRIY